MGFKMKGFPMRSAFKHADQGHSEKDHQHIQVEQEEEKRPKSNIAEFDIDKEKGAVTRQLNAMQKWMDEYNAADGDVPYPHNKVHDQREIENMTNMIEQLNSGNLEGYQRYKP